jgi:FkbM family methyltransferase
MTIEEASNWFRVYYSQNMEDLVLKAFFGDIDKGFYVDIGAHDPDVFSVTKLFYEAGWTGINVEPLKTFCSRLTKARPLDINLNVAVAEADSKLLIREYSQASGLSTLSVDMQNEYLDSDQFKDVTNKFKEYYVETKKLETIFDEHVGSKTVHFLKIDVEGLEWEVIKSQNWSKYRPMLLCIEANHIVRDWHPLLESANYKKIFDDGLNEYHAAGEVYDNLIKNFKYADTVLSKIPISEVPFSAFGTEIKKLSREVNKLNKIIKRQDKLLKDRQL